MDIDFLQKKLTNLYSLLSSISSYDHSGHGFKFFDEKQMKLMQNQKSKQVKELERTIKDLKKNAPDLLDQWILLNQNLLKNKMQIYMKEAKKNPLIDPDYDIKLIKKLIKSWKDIKVKNTFDLDLTAYWGLKIL